MSDEEWNRYRRDWPMYRAVVRDFGTDRPSMFHLLRETLGVGPAEAKSLLDARGHLEVAQDLELREVKKVAGHFRVVGADVTVELAASPPRVTVQDALEIRTPWHHKEPVSVEGYLVPTGLFSYLAVEQSSARAILVSGPELYERLYERVRYPTVLGRPPVFEGRALAEGLLHSIDMPMFPVWLDLVRLTCYPEDGEPFCLTWY
jgi:hypothetical protein